MKRRRTKVVHHKAKKVNPIRKFLEKWGVLVAVVLATAIALPIISARSKVLPAKAQNGFDQYGYNYNARIFQGKADGVDRILDEKVWGDTTYANDHLVMKWSKGWDEARFNGKPWSTDAWENNEWNGKVSGGSGEVWHYKIVWIGNCGADGTQLPDGGYCIWGQFETIFDQGTSAESIHSWLTHVKPNGYGFVR